MKIKTKFLDDAKGEYLHGLGLDNDFLNRRQSSTNHEEGEMIYWTLFFYFIIIIIFLSLCYFFGPLPQHMEVPRLGVKSEL